MQHTHVLDDELEFATTNGHSRPVVEFEPAAPWTAPSRRESVLAAVASARSRAMIATGRALTIARKRAGEARLRAAIERETGQVKVSFGAGTVDLPGWIDTDFTWRAQHCLDVTRPWPVPAGSIDFVYADQVIEHFPLNLGRAVLRNVFEALAPGGMVRLATPDVERTARLYLAGGATCAEHLARHRRRGYAAEHPVDLLRVTFNENGHDFCYDLASLTAELERVGFEDVRRHEVGESDIAEFRSLESRADPTEVATTLVVEARKPMGR